VFAFDGKTTVFQVRLFVVVVCVCVCVCVCVRACVRACTHVSVSVSVSVGVSVSVSVSVSVCKGWLVLGMAGSVTSCSCCRVVLQML
jgi:hypothetical protein